MIKQHKNPSKLVIILVSTAIALNILSCKKSQENLSTPESAQKQIDPNHFRKVPLFTFKTLYEQSPNTLIRETEKCNNNINYDSPYTKSYVYKEIFDSNNLNYLNE